MLFLHVAPFAGAWIEIFMGYHTLTATNRSLPSRERGLKYFFKYRNMIQVNVAPFAGAWIKKRMT